jgi:ferredoxin
MKISIDKTLCTGCSLCYTDVPEVYAMDDDGLAKVILESPQGPLGEKAKEAGSNCPADAIRVE